MSKPEKAINKYILPIITAAIVLVSVLSTVLVVNLTSKDKDSTQVNNSAPEGYISLEDVQKLLAAVTLSAGELDPEFTSISTDEGNQINNAVMEMEQMYVDAPLENAVMVKDRVWSRYTSRIAKQDLTFQEAAMYDRYDEACQKYLKSPALSAVKGKSKDGGIFYYGQGCDFKDLNLTQEQAKNIYSWFKFNNPQYYFLTNSGAVTDDQVFLNIYKFAADGNERAQLTNELFDKLDDWIESVNDDETTTWQKMLSANNLLCKKLHFEKTTEPETNYRIDQSMYTALKLENAVCASYSLTFCAMMNASDIDTMVALSPTHAWNIVKFDDGNYYGVDVLWNENNNDDNNPSNGYFICSESTLQSGNDDHTNKLEYAAWTPALSGTDYAPTVYDMTGSQSGTMELTAPKNVRIESNSDGIVKFAWDSVNNATEYEFNFYNAKTSFVYVNKTYSGTSVRVRTGLNDDMRVKVRAKSVVDGKTFYSDWSADLVISGYGTASGSNSTSSGSAAPAAPKNVKASANSSTSCLIEWDKVEGAESYKTTLFRDSEHKTVWTTGNYTITSIIFNKLAPKTTYYFGVQAVKTVDGKEVFSDFTYVNYTVPEDTSAAVQTKLDAPTNAKGTKTGETTGKFSWDSVPGATGYEFCFYFDAEFKKMWGTPGLLTKAETSRVLEKGKTYYLAVRAVKSENGVDSYSDWTYFSYTHPADNTSSTGNTGNTQTITYSNSVYVGEVKDGQPNGYGKLTYNDGSYYEGDFVNGKRTGKGKFVWTNGTVYEGDFVDGKLTGKGKYTFAGGSYYEGDFVNDKRTGKGKFVWINGNVYEGDFVDGKLTGKGKYTWVGGYVYEGDFVDDKRTGKGKYTFPGGSYYEGDFVDDKRTGKGKFVWINGNVYEGDFVDGKLTGYGTMTYADGTKKTGTWKDDQFIG